MVGKPFTKERYGVGLKKGDTDMCTKVTDAIKPMISDGAWQKAVDDNLGAAATSRARATRPPRTPAPDRWQR